MSKKLTIDDIARIAGVSKTTVSRVLSGSDLVKPDTMTKVRQVIKETNFQPNILARALSTKKTNTIGVIIDELANPFFVEVASCIESILYECGYLMLLCSSGWDKTRELDLTKSLVSRSVDGVILASTSNSSPAIDFLSDSNIPFVLFNLFDNKDDYNYVCVDDYAGGRLAGEYFTGLSVEQYVVLSGYDHISLTHRRNGFNDGLKDKADNRPVKCYTQIETYQDGYNIAEKLIKDNSLRTVKTGIFVLNDNVAIGMLDGLIKEGIQIPEQVAVIGFDNIDMAAKYRVGLSTVAQPIERLSSLAATELLRFIHNKNRTPKKYLLEPKLIIRESTSI